MKNHKHVRHTRKYSFDSINAKQVGSNFIVVFIDLGLDAPKGVARGSGSPNRNVVSSF